MRLASESDNFPYEQATVCYLEVDGHGVVTSPPEPHVSDRVRSGESRLYAVWPGHYRSDLFLIDDIDEYEKALGLQPAPERTGLQEHEHRLDWRISPAETQPEAAYVEVEATLTCGCEIRDLRTFAEHLRAQRGWHVTVTGGLRSSTSAAAPGRRTYTFRARRRSLT